MTYHRETGHVNSLDEYFCKCKAAVAPLRCGAGIKSKVVMSMSYGLPCVATSMATEGMGVEPGKNILQADDSDIFAEQVVTVCNDSLLWETISNNSLEFFKKNCLCENAG